ncbi:DUF6461 domain-containing protein [Demequina sp. NBRC 110051]|uniref:DUF6461 domain-containing protein n=1 Tax=Demequina sp. NBRC 110051 TaxID=1570340 RepID=UPI000A03A3C7|nr:DUF6461 domain-containing protein [Demequina sp. NBRC 110051]
MPVDAQSWVATWDALCVSVTRNSPARVTAAIAGSDLREFADQDSASNWLRDDHGSRRFDPRGWFATGTVDDWTFVWEDNGYQGITPATAFKMADGHRLESMFWNVNLQMRFIEVRDRAVTRNFVPFAWGQEWSWVGELGEPLPGEADLAWVDAPQLSGLALLSMTAGIRAVFPDWLDLPDTRFWGHYYP